MKNNFFERNVKSKGKMNQNENFIFDKKFTNDFVLKKI
jgi:hypothetical protein